MRLDEIMILEDNKDLDQVIDLVIHECKPWIDETQNCKYTVWRGLNSEGIKPLYHKSSMNLQDDVVLRINVRQDRTPKDSSMDAHNFFMKIINDKGFIANRHNSLFVSGDIVTAESYGDVFSVIPVGEFNFTWNTHVDDLWAAFAPIAKGLEPADEKDVNFRYDDMIKNSKMEKVRFRKPYKKRILDTFFNKLNDMSDEEVMDIADQVYISSDNREQNISSIRDFLTQTITSASDIIPRYVYKVIGKNATEAIEKSEIAKIKLTDKELRQIMLKARHESNSLKSITPAHPDNFSNDATEEFFGKYFTDQHLIQAIKSKNEIMINCKQAIVVSEPLLNQFKKRLRMRLDKKS